jgi:hypothetical protein
MWKWYQVCEPWRKVSYNALGFGSCEDRCPNGVYVDPNSQPPSGGQVQQSIKLRDGSPTKNVTSLPQQFLPSGPTDKVANPPGLSGPLTPGTSGPVKLVKVPFCVACGSNEYSSNNQCHACGPNAVANIAARSCTSCGKGQIAKLINGAPTCAADCSKVFGGKKRGTSTNYITDPKNLSRCVACVAGTTPNATHTACLGTPALSSKPLLPQPGGHTTRKKKKSKGEGTTTTVKMNCPPRTSQCQRDPAACPISICQAWGPWVLVRPRAPAEQLARVGANTRPLNINGEKAGLERIAASSPPSAQF